MIEEVLYTEGPSPRVRGNPYELGMVNPPGRSIPACAGKPSRCSSTAGGTGSIPACAGNLGLHHGVGGGLGSIPACAGKPVCSGLRARTPRVHPRVCGKPSRPARSRLCRRVHPRVCGKPWSASLCPIPEWGPSPACAGKPVDDRRQVGGHRVHPRVCGETRSFQRTDTPRCGPSPRVRGNRWESVTTDPGFGSIPACAGKPGPARACGSARRVHPRVCGETSMEGMLLARDRGPSPRVRGNQAAQSDDLWVPGSIPACAGKPRWPGPWASSTTRRGTGPSPRVRGNLVILAPADHDIGSIPACAGKPRVRPGYGGLVGVHPRVCGETANLDKRRPVTIGPSPRVRGNPTCSLRAQANYGSIPACAGKPKDLADNPNIVRVHPRVCGETAVTSTSGAWRTGPSPRVRGNPGGGAADRHLRGSIPACAGKPRCCCRCSCRARVHPRVCGETPTDTSTPSRVAGPSPRVRGNPEPALS